MNIPLIINPFQYPQGFPTHLDLSEEDPISYQNYDAAYLAAQNAGIPYYCVTVAESIDEATAVTYYHTFDTLQLDTYLTKLNEQQKPLIDPVNRQRITRVFHFALSCFDADSATLFRPTALPTRLPRSAGVPAAWCDRVPVGLDPGAVGVRRHRPAPGHPHPRGSCPAHPLDQRPGGPRLRPGVGAGHPERRAAAPAGDAAADRAGVPQRHRAGELRHGRGTANVRPAGRPARGAAGDGRPADLPGRRGTTGRRGRAGRARRRHRRTAGARPVHAARLLQRARAQPAGVLAGRLLPVRRPDVAAPERQLRRRGAQQGPDQPGRGKDLRRGGGEPHPVPPRGAERGVRAGARSRTGGAYVRLRHPAPPRHADPARTGGVPDRAGDRPAQAAGTAGGAGSVPAVTGRQGLQEGSQCHAGRRGRVAGEAGQVPGAAPLVTMEDR